MNCNPGNDGFTTDVRWLVGWLVGWLGGWVEVITVSFNTISVISWPSILLVEETGVPGENYRPVTSNWRTYHIKLYRVHLAWAGFELTTLLVIALIVQVAINPITIWSRPRWPPHIRSFWTCLIPQKWQRQTFNCKHFSHVKYWFTWLLMLHCIGLIHVDLMR